MFFVCLTFLIVLDPQQDEVKLGVGGGVLMAVCDHLGLQQVHTEVAVCNRSTSACVTAP